MPSLLLALLVAASPPDSLKAPRALRVLAVVSQDAEPYRQALAGLRQSLLRTAPSAAVQVLSLGGDVGKVAEAIDAAARERPDLIVVLGSAASRPLVAAVKDLPIVVGLVLSPADAKPATNVTGVYLEYSVAEQWDWLRRMLPKERRVGVIYQSAEVGRRLTDLKAQASQAGVTLYPVRIEGPAGLPAALEEVRGRADVLWGINDPVVYNAETARALLLFCLQRQLPLVAQSESWVKAGALYALERDYSDLGVQIGELAAQVLSGKEPKDLESQSPRKIRISVNQKTASELNIRLPESPETKPESSAP